MLDEFLDHVNPTTILVTLIAYGFCMAVLWKFNFMGSWPMQTKIIISVLAVPVIYLSVAFQMNR